MLIINLSAKSRVLMLNVLPLVNVSNLFASLARFGLGCRPEDNGRCQVRFPNCPSAVSDSAPCLSFGKRRLSLGEAECGSGRQPPRLAVSRTKGIHSFWVSVTALLLAAESPRCPEAPRPDPVPAAGAEAGANHPVRKYLHSALLQVSALTSLLLQSFMKLNLSDQLGILIGRSQGH